IVHEGYCCDECQTEVDFITGFRWKCSICPEYDLCNICYMSNKHDLSHKFQRIVVPNSRENMNKSREESRRIKSNGIFKGATVVAIADEREEKKGTVLAIVDYMIDSGRSDVSVDWRDGTDSSNRILELSYDYGGTFYYYHDHLPVLGRESRGYIQVNFGFDKGPTKKIKVNIWHTVQQIKKLTFKPSLYLIFANHTEVDKKDEKMTLLDEVIEFAKKSKLPCHVVGQKVLFHSGSSNTVFIHCNTDKDTVKELVKKGFRNFERGDIDQTREDEIHYFIRMAKYVIGEAVLPVIISFRNGGMKSDVMPSAADSQIPIIRIKVMFLSRN
ncbi:Hypothetical predicted protein, partial [Mytilus galloprovincialis]